MDPPDNPHGGPGMRIRVLGEPIAVKSGKKTAALKAWIERVRAESEIRILPPGADGVRLDLVPARDSAGRADTRIPLDDRVAVLARVKEPRAPPAPGLLLRLLAEPHAPRDQ